MVATFIFPSCTICHYVHKSLNFDKILASECHICSLNYTYPQPWNLHFTCTFKLSILSTLVSQSYNVPICSQILKFCEFSTTECLLFDIQTMCSQLLLQYLTCTFTLSMFATFVFSHHIIRQYVVRNLNLRCFRHLNTVSDRQTNCAHNHET